MKFAMPACAHTVGKACLRRIQIAERNEAKHEQAGAGQMLTRREVKVKRSEPDEVRPVLRRAVCDLQPRGAPAERSQSARRVYTSLDGSIAA